MSKLRTIKPALINAYRWATWPYRSWAFRRAVQTGTMPVAVLFYHRVADDAPSPWTISKRGFRQQIDWLQRHFDIVSLEEAQNRIRSGHNCQPTVSITFDDGYADNTTFALPVLIKRGLPATYFVTTQHSADGSPFDHDVQQGCPQPPNSIEALRALYDAGVEIGAHTRTHFDVGSTNDPAVLFDEVVTATRELERSLQRRVRFFAFPFGQIDNLHPQVFCLARQHGFEAVCSAYGGWNEIGGDAFHLQRFHGDPEIAYIKNWLTLDPRKRWLPQSQQVKEMISASTKNNLAAGQQMAGERRGPVESLS